jgi:ankyrin repeat protein
MEEYLRLEKEGADFNISNEFGMTPLMSAAHSGNVELVKLLLKYVRNVNQEDKEGNTALYYAVENNHLEVVKVLHEHGAKISDFIYIYSITTKKKQIVRFFDMQDTHKQVFLR